MFNFPIVKVLEMLQLLNSPQIIAAIVAAITSVVVFFLTLLTKNSIEKRLLIFKLNTEHEFEQKKRIKNVLAAYKTHLLNACENLNHRLWNFGKPDHYLWLNVNGDFANKSYHYFHSFAYRIIAVYAWIHKIQSELIHLDLTIASKEDLELIKFMRFYGRIFSDTAFFKGYDADYDYNVQTDHIFKNNFDDFYQSITEKSEIISFNEYLEKIPTLHKEKLFIFYRLIDGVNSTENRLRWHWFQILKMLNLAFLNSYGYDYQQTSDSKMLIAKNTPLQSKLYGNFIFLLQEHKLDKQKEIKRLILLLQTKN